MKRVYQSVVDPVRGDCLASCVASILELDRVPNWVGDAVDLGDPHTWYADMNAWLLARGLASVEVQFKHVNDYRPLPGVFCIATVPSQRFDGQSHAVVGTWRDVGTHNVFEVAHDPNPCNAPYPFTTLPFLLRFLVPFVPVVCAPG